MYIRNYNNYKENKVNEEFLGGILKKLGKSIKSKIAIGMSKKLGSAKGVEKVIDEYKAELTELAEEKKSKIKAIAELEKAKSEGGDISEKIDKAVKAYKKSEEVYEKQKDNLKEKFDLKFKEIVKNEENPAISQYIKLRKIDMVSELLQQEMMDLNEEMGISDEIIESSEILQNIIGSSKEDLEKMSSLKGEVEKAAQEQMDKYGDGKSEDDKEGGNEDREFKPGDKIIYFISDDEKDENPLEATVTDEQVDEKGEKLKSDDPGIRVKKEDTPNGFVLPKKLIKPEEKKEEEEKKEDTGNDDDESKVA